jgi:VPDSG-CTERM motif
MNKMKYLAALLIGVAGLGLQQAQATTLNLENNMHWSTNDPYLIGTVIPGLNGNGGQAARDAAMTNTLLGMATPSQAGTWGDQSDPLYSRTTLNTTGYPAATVAGNSLGSGIPEGGATLTITLTGSFQYLVVAYDGVQSGVAVFDIHTLSAGDQIVLARYAFPSDPVRGDLVEGPRYKMTSWTLLNPTTVPDGGATVMLLGAALGALGMARRFIMS